MQQPKTIEARDLAMMYSPEYRTDGNENGAGPSQLAEAAIRVLGACLLLYQQYVPVKEYYEVHPTN